MNKEINKVEIINLLKEIKNRVADQVVYIAGGPIRDWLLQRPVSDIDLVIEKEALIVAKLFADKNRLPFVLLDEKNEVARVVAKNFTFDFSSYREDAFNIYDDLSKRDFTINAMALSLDDALKNIIQQPGGIILKKVPDTLIDPFQGRVHLQNKIIKPVALENLKKDPLRMLRAYRFMAAFGFKVHEKIFAFILKNNHLIVNSASERIDYELEKIMESSRAAKVLRAMHKNRLLEVIIPEVKYMEGVEQPGFHHLDVLGHLFETLHSIEILIKEPSVKFEQDEPFKDWLCSNKKKIPWLKWAAFMHDFGKPSKKAQREDGRVTFYEHDKEGAQMVKDVAKRLRWPREKERFVSTLVRLHMRPFHLLNDLRKSGPTKRAMRRLLEHIEKDYPALFLLAMADSMAGCGPMKPQELDEELAMLFNKLHTFYKRNLTPVQKRPPLLRGNDVLELFRVEPGPIVGKALRAIKDAQIEGIISNRKEAVDWLLEHKDEIFEL